MTKFKKFIYFSLTILFFCLCYVGLVDTYTVRDKEYREANEVSGEFSITFDSNGGSEVASLRVTDGGLITKPDNPSKTGYIFTNWYSDSEKSTIFDFNSSVSSNMTLYAGWSPITYTIGYYSYDGSKCYGSSSATYDETIKLKSVSALGAPTYDFYGWALTTDAHYRDFANVADVVNLTDKNNEEVKLYLVSRTTYTMTFNDSSKRKLSCYEYNNDRGCEITVPDVDDSNTDWTGIGYYVSTADRIYYPGENYYTKTSGNLFAVYEKDFIIKYDGNGAVSGSVNNDVRRVTRRVNYNTDYVMQNHTFTISENNFVNTGYKFVGWYMASKPNNILKPGDTYTLSGINHATEITLLAKWEEDNDAILGDLNGNRVIELSDVLMELKLFFNQNPSEGQLRIGDMNKDGVIDLTDVLILLKMFFELA